jgi:hypothetical protein
MSSTLTVELNPGLRYSLAAITLKAVPGAWEEPPERRPQGF